MRVMPALQRVPHPLALTHLLKTGLLIVASLALFAPAGLFAGEGDWVFWRGPHLNGTADATGLPESWSPKGPGTHAC